MDISDLVGAAFMPTDGQANPSDITQALAKGARMAGASIFEDTKVTDLEIENGKYPRGDHRSRAGSTAKR